MQLTLDNVQVMDVTDAANNVNDAETNEMFDVVNSFVHVHNIEKFRIIVNVNSRYFVFQLILEASEPAEILVVNTIVFRPIANLLVVVHLQFVEFDTDVKCKQTNRVVIDDFEKLHINLLFDYNIEKYRIIVNTNSVYFIIQITWVLTDDERFVIFGDMELLEMYA